MSPLPTAREGAAIGPGVGVPLPPVPTYLPVSSSAPLSHHDHFLGPLAHHSEVGRGPLAVAPPPPFLLDPKGGSPYGSIYGSLASQHNTSLDCQPADLSIGSSGTRFPYGQEEYFLTVLHGLQVIKWDTIWSGYVALIK